jgi:hypothetical protein
MEAFRDHGRIGTGMFEPVNGIGGEIGIAFAEDLMGFLILVDLNEIAPLAKKKLQRVEDFGLSQFLRRQKGVGWRGGGKVDEYSLERGSAETAVHGITP